MIALIDGEPRICSRCKTGTEFHKGAWYCKSCANEKSREWHKNRANLDKRNAKVNERMKQRKAAVVQEFGGACYDCKGVFPDCVYDFHHLDGSTKDHNPSYLLKMNPERWRIELEKCVMLCSNCHRLRHFT